MRAFTALTDRVLSLPFDEIDTDIIFPARFLLVTEKRGLGRYAFADRRGTAGFPVGLDDTQTPAILVTGANFGCGSSREQAPWALADLGIRAVIAPSLGEIFRTNCTRNGIVPVLLPADTVSALHGAAELTVDLVLQTVRMSDGRGIGFDIAAAEREALLNGWDETARIMALSSAAITRFEAGQRERQPWLWSA
ncbi:3-isopropylmalate dehydratase small subunit [Sphingomonas immobilis]|uniref:3-isopropylmalate dehydratase n=1 Tax=Sphingomonas immobilis TaxID=3063997 RepID=A0ABT9A1H7_9SPHN|nr:3-isopropylmalate dehydratase small subunit [Sphingomonas sp. CA1-15]MDO7843408.1 3-isopropylmalate dehydratase small subunit [Sphingomonas sp. CA1-15]